MRENLVFFYFLLLNVSCLGVIALLHLVTILLLPCDPEKVMYAYWKCKGEMKDLRREKKLKK